MGVEKNLIDAKFHKSNSLDLYRPPALRNNCNEAKKRNSYHATEPFETMSQQTLKTGASMTNSSLSTTTTTTITPANTTTSISCNSSPIHKKETTTTVASSIITTDATLSTHQNNPEQQQQQQQHQPEAEEQQKQPQRPQQQPRRERRPDRAVYIPRARRSQTTPPTTATTQIQQQSPLAAPLLAPAPSSSLVPAPPPPTTTTTTTTITTANYTGKSLNQQLAITVDDTPAASVNERPSSKADEVGKTNVNSVASNISNHTTKTKKDKANKEAIRERREQRILKKSLSTPQPNNSSKNNTLLHENTLIKVNEGEFSASSVILIAEQSPKLLESLSSPIKVNSIECAENININPKENVSNNDVCDKEQKQIVNDFESSKVEDQKNSSVVANYLNSKEIIAVQNDNCAINELQTQLHFKPTDTVSINFTNTNSNNPNTNTTMPKPSSKAKVNKTSSAVDVGNTTKLSNLRIEDVASQPPTKCDIEEQELQRASKEINRSNRRIIKQTFASDVLQIPDQLNEDCNETKPKVSTTPAAKKQTIPSQRNVDSNTEEEEEDDWESMFDDNGECLDPKIMQELTASLGKCKIELPKMDYSAFHTKQAVLNDEEFPHVLEVSNFPVEFKNQDLLMVFSQYKESGFDIKWVDDTHALAVFSSSRIAAEVLTTGHPFVVLKPLAEATVESRLKAKKCSASLQPYRPRPETCAALARRLVTGALGVRLKTAAAERENEKRVLREAKERKLLAAKQREETWDS